MKWARFMFRTRPALVIFAVTAVVVAQTSLPLASNAVVVPNGLESMHQSLLQMNQELQEQEQNLMANLASPCVPPGDIARAYQALSIARKSVAAANSAYDVFYQNLNELSNGEYNFADNMIALNDAIQISSSALQLAVGLEAIPVSGTSGLVTNLEKAGVDSKEAKQIVGLYSSYISGGSALLQTVASGTGFSMTDVLTAGSNISSFIQSAGLLSKFALAHPEAAKGLGIFGSSLGLISNLWTAYQDYQSRGQAQASLGKGLNAAFTNFLNARVRAVFNLLDLQNLTKKCDPAKANVVSQTQLASVDTSQGLAFRFCDGLVCGNENSPSCIINRWIPSFPGTTTPPVLRFRSPFAGAKLAAILIHVWNSGTPEALGNASRPESASLDWVSGNNQNWNTGLLDTKPRTLEYFHSDSSGGSVYSVVEVPLAGSSVATGMGASFRIENGAVCGLSNEEKSAFESRYGSYKPAYNNYRVTVVWKPGTVLPNSVGTFAAVGTGSTGLEGTV